MKAALHVLEQKSFHGYIIHDGMEKVYIWKRFR